MHSGKVSFVVKQGSRRLWVTLVTILMVTLSAVPSLAQGDLYAPINPPIAINPSAAPALADLYPDAMMKPLEQPSRNLHDYACGFAPMTRDALSAAAYPSRSSIRY